MTSVLWLRRDLRRRDHPALLAARDAAGDGDLVVAFVVDPAAVGRRRRRATGLAGGHPRGHRRRLRRLADPAARRPAPGGARARGAGGRLVGARVARDDPGRSSTRRRRGEGLGGQGHRVGRDGHAVRRGTGSGRQRLGRALQGVHAVLQGVAGARLARPGADPARAAAAPRPQRRRRHGSGEGRPRGAGPAGPAPGGRGGGPAEVAGVPRRRARRPTPTTATDPTSTAPRGSRPTSSSVCVHPRTLLADLAGERAQGARTYANELAWREFYADVLWHQPRTAWHDLRPEMSRMRYDEPEDAHRGVAHRAHRLPGRRRRHAPAARAGLDAQPGADDHGQLPHQGPARVVAGRGTALPRAPGRRRHRLEQPRLAVGGRHGNRRLALLPGVQPGHPGAQVRPRRRLRAAVGARARAPGRCRGRPRAVGRTRRLRARLPRRIVDHAAERLEALSRLDATKR